MEHKLNANERRVMGVLIEKALTQPDYYPMTSNAIVTACNQRSNRYPIMDLDEDTVLATLEVLRKRGLVSLVLPAPGARVNRYKHEIEKAVGWNKRQQAIMAELLLRGPQTTGELRAHCSRMFPIESIEAVAIVLESLARPESGPPIVAVLPRETGQSAVRYTHLLYPEDEAPAPAVATPGSFATASPAPSPGGDRIEPWRCDVDALNTELASLREAVAELHRRVDALERGNPSG